MKVTERTRQVLHYRREVRRLLAAGFEEVGEGGGRLWDLKRGSRIGQRIVDVAIGPDGTSVYVRVAAA